MMFNTIINYLVDCSVANAVSKPGPIIGFV